MQYNSTVPHNIGPKQKYHDPFRNVVSIMLILQNKRPIIYGDGDKKDHFLAVMTVFFV